MPLWATTFFCMAALAGQQWARPVRHDVCAPQCGGGCHEAASTDSDTAHDQAAAAALAWQRMSHHGSDGACQRAPEQSRRRRRSTHTLRRAVSTANPPWMVSVHSKSSRPSTALEPARNVSSESGRKDQCAASTARTTSRSCVYTSPATPHPPPRTGAPVLRLPE